MQKIDYGSNSNTHFPFTNNHEWVVSCTSLYYRKGVDPFSENEATLLMYMKTLNSKETNVLGCWNSVFWHFWNNLRQFGIFQEIIK